VEVAADWPSYECSQVVGHNLHHLWFYEESRPIVTVWPGLWEYVKRNVCELSIIATVPNWLGS